MMISCSKMNKNLSVNVAAIERLERQENLYKKNFQYQSVNLDCFLKNNFEMLKFSVKNFEKKLSCVIYLKDFTIHMYYFRIFKNTQIILGFLQNAKIILSLFDQNNQILLKPIF